MTPNELAILLNQIVQTQLQLAKAINNNTAAQLKLISTINSLSNSVNDMCVVMELADMDGTPRFKMN